MTILNQAKHPEEKQRIAASGAPASTPLATRDQRGYLVAAALVVLAGILAKLLVLIAPLSDPALVLLIGVLGAAVVCELRPALFAALASAAVYDFFFIEPIYTFSTNEPHDAVSLVVFLVVASLTSTLATRLRAQAQATEALLEEKSKTESVIEAIEDGLIVLEPGGLVAHINEVACAILQVDRTAVHGLPFEALASRHPHYLRIRAAVADFLSSPQHEADRVEVTLFMRGRDHFFVLRPTLFYSRNCSQAGLIVALQDVTYLRDQENQRETLVGTLSHELRTPLTSLSMAIELLGRGAPLDPEQTSCLETARVDVARLQDLSQRLLDLSRTRAMTIALERVPVDLREVVARLVMIFTPQARDKSIALEVLLPPTELSILGDETKLSWALSNLLSNAVRYTPVGGRVAIEAEVRADGIVVAVSDSGPGIAPPDRERIFEPFAQAFEPGEVGSAGLGLAIVRDIVQAHGGRVYLDSSVGRGSRFALELPRGG